MVNPGHPSRGCQTCRARKIKCDEGRPHCRKCIRAERTCLGYRDVSTVVFRNQNELAKQLVAAPKNNSDPTNGSTETTTATIASSSAVPASFDFSSAAFKAIFAIPPAVFQTPEDFAIQHFYREHVVTTGSLKVLEFLPDLIECPRTCKCLQESVHATALMAAGMQLDRYDLVLLARQHYGRTLALLNKYLLDPEHTKKDCLIVAVLLLAVFGVLGSDMAPQTLITTHMRGFITLLRMRGPEFCKTPIGRSLSRMGFYHLIADAFVTRKPPHDDVKLWATAFQENGALMLFSRNILRVVQRCADMYAIIDHKPSSSITTADLIALHGLIIASVELDAHLKSWALSIAHDPAFAYETIPNPEPILENEDPPAFVHTYSGLDTPSLCNISYASRLCLADATLNAITFLTDHIPPPTASTPSSEAPSSSPSYIFQLALDQRQHCQTATNEAMEGICSTIAWLLGEIDSHGNVYDPPRAEASRAFSLLAPLAQAYKLGNMTAGRRVWVKRKIVYVAYNMGHGLGRYIVDAMLQGKDLYDLRGGKGEGEVEAIEDVPVS